MSDMNQTADVVMTKVAVVAEKGGAVVAAGSGGAYFLGWSPAQWSIAGVVAGIVIGFIGMVANAAITFYFKSQHLKLERARLDEVLPDGD